MAPSNLSTTVPFGFHELGMIERSIEQASATAASRVRIYFSATVSLSNFHRDILLQLASPETVLVVPLPPLPENRCNLSIFNNPLL